MTIALGTALCEGALIVMDRAFWPPLANRLAML